MSNTNQPVTQQDKDKAAAWLAQYEAIANKAPRLIKYGSSPTIKGLMNERGELHGLDKPYQDALLTCVKHFFNKADPHHQWQVKMIDVRDNFVRGLPVKELEELKDQKNLSDERIKYLDLLREMMKKVQYITKEVNNEKFEQANKWLEENGYKRMTDEAKEQDKAKVWTDGESKDITFEKAIELIKKFWDKQDTIAVSNQILTLYTSRSECLVIIGIPNDKENLKLELKDAEQERQNKLTKEQKNAEEEKKKKAYQSLSPEEKIKDDEKKKAEDQRILTDDEKKQAIEIRNSNFLKKYKDQIAKINSFSDEELKNSGINGNSDDQLWTDDDLSTRGIKKFEFEYCLMSVYAKKLRVINSLDKRIKEKLWIKPIIVSMKTMQNQIIQQVRDTLINCDEKKISKMLLYFCGHGHEDYGGWVAGNSSGLEPRLQFVRIIDILDTIKNHHVDNISVEITSESCYSGKQVYKAKEWWEENMEKPGMTNLRVLGSTYAYAPKGEETYKSQKGIWGYYQLYKYNQTRDRTELKERKQFQRWYTNTVGLTVFDSTRTPESILNGKYEDIKQEENKEGNKKAQSKQSQEQFKITDQKAPFLDKDQPSFPFPIYTNFPQEVLYSADGQFDQTQVSEESFKKQYWKEVQYNEEFMKDAYNAFISREKLNHDNLDKQVQEESFPLHDVKATQ